MSLRGPKYVQAVFLLLVAATPAMASDHVPDWVRTAAAQSLPKYPETTKAVILLHQVTYTVAPDGRATEHVRSVMKILRPQGRELAEPVVWYDKDSKITSFHVWSIDPSGHEYAMKDNEIRDIGAFGGDELYSDERARVAEPPGRDPGGVIAYEYEERERPYLAETNWFFQSGIPRLQQSFTLNLPAGFTYTTTWAHHDKVEPDPRSNSYVWAMNDEEGIDLESVPLSPATDSLSGRMTVHYAGPGLAQPQEGTWKGIGEWYEGLSRDRLNASPEIAAKTAELTAGKTDFFDKTEAVAVYLQKNIRYVAVEMGVGGYQPHAAADTFRGKYGDCKDKATLLSAMLSTIGVHSALLMVDTERGVIDAEDPSIVGNHMIGAIEVPPGYESPKMHSVLTAKTGKRYLIFDPTWTETPFGQLESNLQGSYAILMEGSSSEVVHLPIMPPELNTIRRTAKFQLDADGTLKGSVTEKRFGDVAEHRRLLAKSDRKEQQEAMDRAVSRDFGSVSLTGLTFTDAATLSKEVVTAYDLQAEHYGSATGPLLMVRPRVVGSYGMVFDHKKRHVPIDLKQTMQGHDEFEIELPAGYTVDELPDPIKLDVGFAAYESRTEVKGNTLHYTRTYTVRDVMLPAAKYKALQEFAGIVGADEESRVILKRAPKTTASISTESISTPSH